MGPGTNLPVGSYTLAYTYWNQSGETMVGPAASICLTGTVELRHPDLPAPPPPPGSCAPTLRQSVRPLDGGHCVV